MKLSRVVYWAYLAAVIVFGFMFWHNKVPWDPCAYIKTGKRLLGEYTYYEALRAPVTSLLYGLFGLHGFIVVSVLLLGYAVYLYSKRKGIPPLLLLTLLLPALSWPYYLEGGSEILALAFLLIGAAYAERAWAGLVFSLVFLARYVYLAFIPFFLPWRLYRRNPRIAVAHLVGFLVPVAVWSVIQWAVFGHPLASYVDFAYVNAYSLPSSLKLPLLDRLLVATLPTTVLSLPGLDLFTVAFLFVALLLAAFPAVQSPRFYIPALIPASLAAARWIKSEKFAVVLALANVLAAFVFVYPSFSWGNVRLYRSIASVMEENCVYISNVWVPLICMGRYAVVPPPDHLYFENLREGYRAVVLFGVGHPAYMEDVNLYLERNIPVLRYDRFFLAGDGCVPPEHVWDLPGNVWELYFTYLKDPTRPSQGSVRETLWSFYSKRLVVLVSTLLGR